MAMPAPSKDWYSLSNKALANVTTAANAANSFLHALFKTLIGQNHGSYTAGQLGVPPSGSYWTVEGSSNGTTASAADNFNNTYASGEWVSNTAGNAHTWFVLKSPTTLQDGPWYLLVSKNSATATSWKYELSKTAYTGFTSTTADPTNAGAVSSTGTVQHFHTSSTTNGKTHFMVDDDGSFWFFGSRDGGSVVDAFASVNALEQTQPSGDSYRAVGYCGYLANGIWSAVNAGQNISGASVLGIHRNGVASSNNLFFSGSNLSSFSELNGINSDAEGLRYGVVYSTLTGNQCIRGVIPDLYIMTTALANASNNPDNVTPVWSAIGATSTGGKMAIPFCATMSL